MVHIKKKNVGEAMISEMQETGFGRKACIINDSG